MSLFSRIRSSFGRSANDENWISPRSIGFAGGVLSIALAIAALLLPFIQMVSGAEIYSPDEYVWYLVVTNFFLLVGIAVISIYYHSLDRRYRKNINRLLETRAELRQERVKSSQIEDDLMSVFGDMAQRVEDISSHRTGVSNFICDLLMKKEFNKTELVNRIDQYIDFCLSQTAELFGRFTDSKTASCVKLITKKNDDGDLLVETYMRNQISRLQRQGTDVDEFLGVFPYKKNTGFSKIIDEDNSRGFWYSNNLIELHEEGEYDNINPRWKEFYSAAAISAIRNPQSSSKDDIIGFLCIDNKDGRFDDRITRPSLAAISNTLYYVLSMRDFIMENLPAKPDDEEPKSAQFPYRLTHERDLPKS